MTPSSRRYARPLGTTTTSASGGRIIFAHTLASHGPPGFQIKIRATRALPIIDRYSPRVVRLPAKDRTSAASVFVMRRSVNAALVPRLVDPRLQTYAPRNHVALMARFRQWAVPQHPSSCGIVRHIQSARPATSDNTRDEFGIKINLGSRKLRGTFGFPAACGISPLLPTGFLR